MRLYIDLDLLALIEQPGVRNVIDEIDLKRGAATTLEVQFCQGGVPVLLPAGQDIVDFTVKPDTEYDAEPLIFAGPGAVDEDGNPATFSIPGSSSGFYTATLPTNTAPLDALLDDDGSPIPEVLGMGEFTWGAAQPAARDKTLDTFRVVINNDVRKGSEGVPTTGAPVYPAANLLLTFANIDGGSPLPLGAGTNTIDGGTP